MIAWGDAKFSCIGVSQAVHEFILTNSGLKSFF